MSYKITILYAHNRELAEKYPEVWSKFRWRMRGTQYPRVVLNALFKAYRTGWYDHLLFTREVHET